MVEFICLETRFVTQSEGCVLFILPVLLLKESMSETPLGEIDDAR